MKSNKKVLTPTKAAPNPSQWTKEDIDVMHHYCYKTDIDRFQTYRSNHMDPADLEMINVKDHSTYIDVAKAHPGTVIEKGVFSVALYHEVLCLKGGDMTKFDKEVGAKFKKSAKGSRVPDNKKVAIDQLMLVCQRPNSIDVAYADKDGFGHPSMMEFWDLHSNNAMSQVKLQLKSGLVNTNFCAMCTFWSTNNETLNNDIQKHYNMGLTCHADGYRTASISAMKLHMEQDHRYEGKRAQ